MHAEAAALGAAAADALAAAEAAALGAAGALAAADAAGDGDVVLDEHAPTSTMTTTASAGVDLSLLTMKFSSSELP